MPTFKSITSTLPFNVTVIVGKPIKIMITGDDNVLPLIKTSVESNTLNLTSENSFWDAQARIIVETPELNAVNLAGSGDIDIRNVDTSAFSAELSGSGNIKAIGKVATLHCLLSGSGNLKLKELRSVETTAELLGSGDIDTFASEKFTSDLTGSGNIRCAGNPKVKKELYNQGYTR